MYLKRLLAFLCCFTLVFCLFPSSAFATGGNGNIDGGGGSMGHGTSSNFWNSGNDGVRITVVDASSGTAVSSPLDFSNRTQKTSLLHFGKVNKLQYLGGAGLSLQSGVAYSCIRPTQSMPTIVSSKGQSNIEAIKRYFCSEYACMMVAQAAGVDYERMIAGEYKLLIEPIAYFTHNGQYYCMTATEAGLYDQMSGGNLRKTMTSLTHKNLPLSMFLEFSDLGISAWTGSTTGKQNNSDIISTLGVGIVWFDEAPPEGEIEAPDVEYRVDTDVITAVTQASGKDVSEFQSVIDGGGDGILPSEAGGKFEGWFEPGTYDAQNKSAEDIIKAMVEARIAKLDKLGVPTGSDRERILIIASIAESEVGSEQYYGKVARVILNRIDAGMPLGMDTTVAYGLGISASQLTDDQLNDSSNPYNTRINKGLPPTPISNPGDGAITAAMDPPEGKWLYFVTTNLKTGETKFVETEDEFWKIRDEYKNNNENAN